MKHIKITNKKTFTAFILFILLLVGTLAFLVYKIVQFKHEKNQTAQQVDAAGELSSPKGISTPKDFAKSGSATLNQENTGDDASSKVSNAPMQTSTEYNNQQYAYTITFPDDWFLNSDASEGKPADANINGKKISVGGQTFWSNYKNINDFSPDQKPADFHLLGLNIYEAPGLSSDDLAKILGFDQDSTVKKTDFVGKTMAGSEYVSAGEDEKNPQVVIIYQKDQRFYVFNVGFPNGDPIAAETMENIAKTLVLK